MRERKFNQIDATVVQQNNANLNTVISTAVSTAISTEVATRTSVDATKLTAEPAANQSASIAEDVAGLKTDFNALLLKLKAAGIMVDDE